MSSYKKILTYNQLLKVNSGENNDNLVNLNKICPQIICQYEKFDMVEFTGNCIYVRKTVAEKLCDANSELHKINPEYNLKVIYGYRHPEVQKTYFQKRKKILRIKNPNLSENKLNSLTHNFVAAPEVSGHITGGAVDITITDNKKDLDMGTKIANYTDEEKIKTFSNKISKNQSNNRKLLHDILIKQNFAPFYGEWWHFSYGDKEWATFYNKKISLYSPIDFKK